MSANTRPRVVLVNRCFLGRDDGTWLIIKRSLKDKNNPGKWEVAGGKVDVGQDLSHAQEREVMEETGYLVEPTERQVFVDSFVIGAGQYKGLPYVVIFSITRLVGGTLALSEEHTDHAWVTYAEMLTYDLTSEVRKAAIVLESRLNTSPKETTSEVWTTDGWGRVLVKSVPVIRVRVVRQHRLKVPGFFERVKGHSFRVIHKREGGYDVDLSPLGVQEMGFVYADEVEEIPPKS
ncbi:MAG: NUDIX domain-containing protein [Parcubacteria group bacterium]|nr:NUDIX domain-containing protein [Parcubacteria group bacterium]